MGSPHETIRFTVDGSDALEQRIAEDVRKICDAAVSAAGPGDLTAVILGGGYGRGEGAVWREGGQEAVYNDYDFFAVTPSTSRRRNKRVAAAVRDAGKRLESEVGVHVDFGRPLPHSNLPHLPYELMMMELKMGHIVLHGPSDVLATMPDYDPKRVPLVEGARLLMNRCVGLIRSRMLLRERRPLQTDEYQFVIRNTQKAMMAAGDAVLFVKEVYSPSYVRRGKIFEELDLKGIPRGEQLRERYRESIEFKLRPRHDLPPGLDLSSWVEQSVSLFGNLFLWFERQRLGEPGMGWDDYMARPQRLPVKGSLERLLNLLRNLRARAMPVCGVRGMFFHPRDHILKTAPRLLYGEGDAASEKDFLRLWRLYS